MLKDSNAPTVNDLLTMYVGAASQHVLRMSFAPEHDGSELRHAVCGILVPPHSTRCHLSIILFYLSNLEDLVLALRFSGMQRPPGVLGNRSFPH